MLSETKASDASGIGSTDGEEHQTEERDADGRRLWEAPLGKKPAAEEIGTKSSHFPTPARTPAALAAINSISAADPPVRCHLTNPTCGMALLSRHLYHLPPLPRPAFAPVCGFAAPPSPAVPRPKPRPRSREVCTSGVLFGGVESRLITIPRQRKAVMRFSNT